MAKKTSITTAGLKELQGRMKRLEVAVEPKDLNPILLAAVTLIKDQALSNLQGAGVGVLTGNLERSFVARASASSKVSSAWTKVGNKAKANHAHLIEYGHRIVGHKPNKTDTGKNTKDSPKASRAIGFFRRAVDTKRAQVRKMINEGIVQLLWNAVK